MRKQKQTKKSTNKLMGFLLTLVMALSMLPLVPQTVKAAADGFYTNGTTIYDANGKPFIMRGVNIAHAWYTGETDTSIKAAASKGANCVRIVCSDGKQYTKTSASELQHIIDVCKQNNVVCIVEVHDTTGSDSTADLNAAVDYWKEMKSILSANKQYVIVNIANEWYGTWDGSAWASGYQSAIPSLRAAGIHNLLMIDCAGWGQYPDSIKYNGSSVVEADPDHNMMFSIHMYEYAGSDASTVRTNIDNALATGVPLTIGEFGFKHTNGDVDEYTIMQYCQQKGAGYMGWSWKGNGSTWAYLDLANTFDGSSLSDWGNLLFYGENGISTTAKTCTIFTGSGSSEGTGDSGNSGDSGSASDYKSLFWGSQSASNWNQAVSVKTSKNGGSFSGSDVKKGGCFYIEYDGDKDDLEFVLQSWSGGATWAPVAISESGSANGHRYIKCSYDNCVSAFGSDDFSSKLDQVHVSAKSGSITVYSVCYIY